MPRLLTLRLRRRRLLALAARSGPACLAAPLAACDPAPPTAAFAAWRGPPAGLDDPALFALSWAVLAPSPLNTQPWLVERPAAERLMLRLDPARLLPAHDPQARQATLALGAFVELTALAAATRDRSAAVELASPDTAATAPALARIELRPGPDKAGEPLLAALPLRRSSRQAFDPEKPLKAGDEVRLRAAVAGSGTRLGIVRAPEAVSALRSLCAREFQAAQDRDELRAEQAAWLRPDPVALADRPDGVPLTGAAAWCLRQAHLLTPRQLAARDSLAALVGAFVWRNLFLGTASFGWLATAGDDLARRIAAGRAYQRLDLACAAGGVAIHPVSEAIEAAGAELAALLDLPPPWRAQMLFRLGYAGPVPPTPRRTAAAVLRAA